MPHQVFISYSSKDKAAADCVCSILESRRLGCWMAPRDVTAGKEYAECIIEALSASRAMVLIYSQRSNRSPQVRREVERAGVIEVRMGNPRRRGLAR